MVNTGEIGRKPKMGGNGRGRLTSRRKGQSENKKKALHAGIAKKVITSRISAYSLRLVKERKKLI